MGSTRINETFLGHTNITGGHTLAHHDPPYAVIFIFAACILGAITRQIMKHLSVPYTVVLLVLGICFGAVSRSYPAVQEYTRLATADPHLFLTIFLPVILFESAFVMDIHVFGKVIWQVLILAGPGTLLAIGLTGVMAKYVFTNWIGFSWEQYFLFGSIVSATDPIAIVSLLKDLGTTKQLGVLIEGESLFNDGAALVFFKIFNDLSNNRSMTMLQIVEYFPRVIFGGVALGWVTGKLTVFWLQHVFNDAMVEITITLSSTYVTYYLGEVFGVSGVLAVVMLGIEINHKQSSISPELQVFLHRFWEILAYLANTIIFLLVGIAIMEEAFSALQLIDAFYIFIDYILLFVIRAIIMIMLGPILKRLGYGLPWQDAVVVTWGALRGAVSLALALMTMKENPVVGKQILLHTAGIVFFTLIANATSVIYLLKMLGISEVSDFKKGVMRNAIKRLDSNKQETWRMLKTDRFLVDADWQLAEEACVIPNPYIGKDAEDDSFIPGDDNFKLSICTECEATVRHKPTEKEFTQMMEDGRTAVLKGQKMSFWRQYDRGVLSSEAVNTLVSLCETCHDTQRRFIEVDDILPHCKIPSFYKWSKKRLEKMKQVHPAERVPAPTNLFLRFCFFIASHVSFDIIMNVAITLNIIPIVLEYVFDPCSAHERILSLINICYFFVFLFEAFIKILAFRKHYFYDKWNWFDLIILVITTVDVVVDVFWPKDCSTAGQQFSASGLKTIKVLKVLRVSRMIKLFKGLIPKIIKLVDGRINTQISFGYDVGKGFVLSIEEVVRILDQLVLDRKIAADLKLRLDSSHLEVVKSLGMLQRQHPGVAISVKTRQAIRTVLNNARDTLNELQSNGALDSDETYKINRGIEVKMKRQLQAPSYIKPKKPEDILKNIVWLQCLEEDGLAYITSNIEMLSFDYGDVIVKQGEPSDGIYVIISGMVKLVGVSTGQTNKETSMNLKISSDYLYAGNVVGEMGLLMNSVRNASVICETIVQAYFISAEKMQRAMLHFKGLKDAIWRVCGIRLAVPLINSDPLYKVYSKDSVRIMCQRSQIAELDGKGVFRPSEQVRESVLIEGTLHCNNSKQVFIGPILLPKSIRAFVYDPYSFPQILLILNKSTGHESRGNKYQKHEPMATTNTGNADNHNNNSNVRSTGCQVKLATVPEMF